MQRHGIKKKGTVSVIQPFRLPALLSQLRLRAGHLLQVPSGKSEMWAEQLVEFYEGVLRSGLVLPSSGGLAEGMRQPSVSTEVYANILTGADP